MPTLQQLRYLVAVADFLHFRRAAEECHVTQPTLSAQLKALEARLGATLVERGRSGVILTPAGEKIAERGRRILRDVKEIRDIARLDQAPFASVMRVGVVQTLGSYLLPLVVPDLHASFPKLGLYVREGLPDDLLRALEAGTLDLLFHPAPPPRSDLQTRPLFREPILLVAPQDHPLARETAVDPAALEGETILSLEPGHKLYDLVRTICDEVGAELSHDFEGTSLDTLRQMVATGMGLSLMPALYVRSEVAKHDIVVARPFSGAAPSRAIGMTWRRGAAREAEYEALARLIPEWLLRKAPEVEVPGA
ncbi:MAG: LysR substrate-binding domain-containing protein [Pseudomonadota bacterium]